MFENLKRKAISFEGGEGSGKGTLIDNLTKYLMDYGSLDILCTREPGGSDIAEKIRDIILDKKNTEICPETEALLFAASRAQVMNDIIFPAIENEETLFIDRFLDSSLVYQGFSRGLGVENIEQISLFATKNWLPDLTIVLDISPEVGLARIKNNNRETNRLDLECISFHQKVREGYLKLAERFPERIVIVNADQTEEAVLKDVLKILELI